jgi:type VI secretion system protein ImpL
MSFVYYAFRSRWVRTFLGAAVVAVLIWFCGPLLGFGEVHPLETDIARIIAIAVVFVLWLVTNLIRELRASRKDKELAEGAVAPSGPAPGEVASAEEVALLSDRLRDALRALKKSGIGGGSRKHLATMPWYILIGPPGTGKTTALINSGLKFPLADASGPQALAGVGGTRNCDWWFTDDAVLIDTAGRYTTQDSDATVDAAAWLGFLRLLKKHRRRQPLNGVLVAISLSDLAELNEEQRMAHARAVRRRVRELHDELGVRLPVYVAFTKADLLAGFVEFFDNLGREEREQVWGITFPLDDGRDEQGVVAGFAAGFDRLLARLNERMLERLQQESDIQRRRLIYGFPQQVASLRAVASDFLTEAFRPSRLEARALLRGAYFTSGTQNGTPIDRLLGTIAAEFGLPRRAVRAFSGAGRSYFLSRLMREVVFAEAGLVGLDPKVERRARLINIGAYAGCAVVLLLLAAFWTLSYIGNRDLIAEVHAATATYAAQQAEVAKRGPADVDLAAVVPPLDTLRGLTDGSDARADSTPVSLTFGLYQGDKLGQAARDGYGHALDTLLRPRLIARVESRLAASLRQADFLYATLKVYLILGGHGKLDEELVRQWFAADLLTTFPGEDDPTRAALTKHIAALLQQPLEPLPLNDPLVAQVRAILNAEPLAEYSYNRILRSKRVQALEPWTVAENATPGGTRVFRLRSGKKLTDGIAGIYTWNGYHKVFQLMLPTVTKDLSDDEWVLGHPSRELAEQLKDTAKLRRDVFNLYLDDYTRQWDAALADIALKPFTTVQEGLDQLSLLSAPASPLRNLLLAIDAQTQLSRTGAADEAQAKLEAKGAKLAQHAAGFASFEARSGLSLQQNELANILGEAFGTDSSGKPVDPAKRVDDHFRALHVFVTATESGPAPMEAALQKLAAIYQSLNQAANAPNQGQALLNTVGATGGGTSAAAQLQDLSRDMPGPVAAMLQSITQSSAQVIGGGAGQELQDAWRSTVLPRCNAAFDRYPFVATSSSDVPPDDFAKLLGPGGQIAQFFDQYLKNFVDTTQRPWHWQSAERTPLGLSAGSLAEFERADQIREALFGDGKQVQVNFRLVPVSLDPGIARISIDIAGQTLVNDHGPTQGVMFQWPGAGGKDLVRVTMTPTGGGAETVLSFDGPWALLRLIDAAKVTPSGQPDKFTVAFGTPSGGEAKFDLIASSVENPFTMTAMRNFRCPAKL